MAARSFCPVCGAAGTPAGERPLASALPLAARGPLAANENNTTLPPRVAGPPPRPTAMRDVPGFEVLGELGRGGMGVVCKARQLAPPRMVALKMALPDPSADGEAVARFRVEAEVISRLTHPNIVQIYEAGEVEGRPYFAMEYVNGRSLSQYLGGSPQPVGQAAQWVEVLARAVQFAHEKGIIHRDLKPANVLVSQDGDLKITDFGLAKRLGTDTLRAPGRRSLLGTPEYMAPEQARGGAAGAASDVYALGVILYEMLTGRRPFEGATPLATLTLVLEEEPLAPGRLRAEVPPDLGAICLKCLEKDPKSRYATAGDLADDLRRFQAGEAVRARSPGVLERAWKWWRRRDS
jgi:serine/threonine-protein kinase